MARILLILGALNAMLAVMLGAFAAHGLRSRVPADLLVVFRTGVDYHFIHAFGLIACGLVAGRMAASGLIGWSGGLMLAGIVLFSGSLYALALSGERWLGAITPFGGVAFILAWLLFALAAWRGGPSG